MKPKIVFVLLSLSLLQNVVVSQLCPDSDTEDEGDDENVMVTFYNMPVSKWKSVKDDFSKELSKGATDFCEEKPSKCGLSSYDTDADGTFDEDLVFFTKNKAELDEDDAYSTLIYVYLAYHQNMNIDGDTSCVVPESGVEKILKEHRKKIEDKIGYYITDIGKETFYIPPSNLNGALSAVAVVILIIIIIIAISCYCWSERQKKIAQRSKQRDHIIELKKNKPSFVVADDFGEKKCKKTKGKKQEIIELENANRKNRKVAHGDQPSIDNTMEEGKMSDKEARKERKKQALEDRRRSQAQKNPEVVKKPEGENGAAVYEPPPAVYTQPDLPANGGMQHDASRDTSITMKAPAPKPTYPRHSSVNYFREEESDSDKLDGSLQEANATTTTYLQVSEAPDSQAAPLEDSTSRKKKKSKKNKKHKRRQEQPDSGEGHNNIPENTTVNQPQSDPEY